MPLLFSGLYILTCAFLSCGSPWLFYFLAFASPSFCISLLCISGCRVLIFSISVPLHVSGVHFLDLGSSALRFSASADFAKRLGGTIAGGMGRINVEEKRGKAD